MIEYPLRSSYPELWRTRNRIIFGNRDRRVVREGAEAVHAEEPDLARRRAPLPVAAKRLARPAGSVTRASLIVDVLIAATTVLGVSEIARRVDLPRSTTARLLSIMVASGIVEREDHGYRASQRLLDQATHGWTARLARLRRSIIPILLRLHDDTGLDVAFATLRYGRVHFEITLYGQGLAPVLSTLPMWAPADSTSTGKVLLAFSEIPRPRRNASGHPTSNPVRQELAEELAAIRRTGMARADGEYVARVSSLAVPVFGIGKRLVGAIAVCGPAGSLEGRAPQSALRKAARVATIAARETAAMP